MVDYRRNRLAGGTYFFTATLSDRRSSMLVQQIDFLREAIRAVRRERPFTLNAICILPDHLHAILTLPPGDSDYPARWRAIKSLFTRACIRDGASINRNANGEYELWQRRYWEHTIRDDNDFARHVDYIHYNPVKHGLARRVEDWRHSSFHRYVRLRLLPDDWAGSAHDDGLEVGE